MVSGERLGEEVCLAWFYSTKVGVGGLPSGCGRERDDKMDGRDMTSIHTKGTIGFYSGGYSVSFVVFCFA